MWGLPAIYEEIAMVSAGVFFTKMWFRSQRLRREEQEAAVRTMAELAEVDEPEPEDWCAGCDELRPRSSMAFVDDDDDGVPDALYRCNICRGVDWEYEQHEAFFPAKTEDQAAADDRANEYLHNGRGYLLDASKITWSHIHTGDIGTGYIGSANFANLSGDSITERYPLVDGYTIAHKDGSYRIDFPPPLRAIGPGHVIDLANESYSEAVNFYRSNGIAATDETNDAYELRLRKREERRDMLARKYGIGSDEWKTQVIRKRSSE